MLSFPIDNDLIDRKTPFRVVFYQLVIHFKTFLFYAGAWKKKSVKKKVFVLNAYF